MNSYNLYCFCLNFLYYTTAARDDQDEDEWFSSVTDKADYIHLPIVVNFNKQCDTSVSTTYRAWVLNNNLLLQNPMLIINNTNALTCFYKCLKMHYCVAVSRDTRQDDSSGDCLLFDKTEANDTNTQYNSYILKDCLYKTYSTNNPQLNLPILISPEEMCNEELLTNGNLDECQSKSWHIQEHMELTIPAYRTMNNSEIFDCLNECIKDKACQAIVAEAILPFESVCYFYKNNSQKQQIKKNERKTLYKMICCPFKKLPSSNLVMLNQHTKYCKKDSHSRYPISCSSKVWHIRNKLRIKGKYKILPLFTMDECLNSCLLNKKCRYVSMDFYEKRCFLITKGSYAVVGQAKWMSFQLECCSEMGKVKTIKKKKK